MFSTKNSHNFNTLVSAHEREPYEMGTTMGWKKGRGRRSSDESQEHIVSSTPDGNGDGMGIRVTTDVHLALEESRVGARQS